MHGGTFVPQVAHGDRAGIAQNGQRAVFRRRQPAGQPRHRPRPEPQAADGKIRRKRQSFRARSLVGEGQRRKGGQAFHRAEQRRQPCKGIAGMLQRAADLELMHAGPFRTRARTPFTPFVAKHRAVFHLGIDKARRADAARCKRLGNQAMRGAQRVGGRRRQRQAESVGQVDQRPRLLEAHRQRLFAIDVPACRQGTSGQFEMAFRRRQIDDDADAGIAEQGFEAFISVDVIEVAKLGEARRVAVEGAHQFKAGMVGQRRHVVVGNETGAEKRDLHTTTR